MQRVDSRNKRQAVQVVELLTDDGQWEQHLPQPSACAHIAASNSSTYPWRHWLMRALAITASALLHTLLIGSALLGTPGRPPLKPLNEGAPASSTSPIATEFVTTLLLFTDHSITPPDRPIDNSAYTTSNDAQQQPDQPILTTFKIPAPPQTSGSDDGTDETSPTVDAMGDAAGRAMLFGRYMGQIKARIERAWDYPNSPSTDSFECRVQIKQSSRGDVQEVTLQKCVEDPAWQASLVQAIQQASPLSAPPNESVYTDVISLNFSAQH